MGNGWAWAKTASGVNVLAGDSPCPSSSSKPLHPAVRVITVIAVVIVAAIAAVVSYSHMQQLAYRVGEGWRSYLIPISIDGLITAASMTLFTRHRVGLPRSPLAWGALGGGILASIAANMADARYEVTAILLAGWAPVAFAIGFELLLLQRRAERHVVSEASATSPETSGGYTQPTTLPTPGAATSATPALSTMQRTSQTSGSPPHQAPALTPPAREAPTANPVTATPAPTTQSPQRPAPQSTDASTARSPNGQTGRGSTAASSNGSGTPERREPRERPTRAGRTIPEDKQERIYRMLRSNVATHEQIAEDCEVHPRTVANYSRKMRDRQMAAARNGNERMVRR